jgi:SET domain-containing protein
MPGKSSNPYFVVRKSSIQGKGAFARKKIKKGTRIIEYIGERISNKEADKRYDDDATDRPHTFLFTVDAKTIIDAAVGGNAARFINHSCGPNCEAVNDDGRIFIEAIKDIPKGAELTYDYQLERSGKLPRGWRRRYACHCGAPDCRGVLLVRPKNRHKDKKRSKSRQRH